MRLLTVALSAACAVFLCVGCQYSDIAAFHNTTAEPVTLRATVEGEFARYDCDGSGSDLVRFTDETEATVQPGQRLCLEGPATDFSDSYDVRDMLVHVEVARGDAVCVEVEGDELFDALVPEGRYKVLTVGDEVCPVGEPAAEAN